MILVDSSIWIDHVRRPDAHLAMLIETSRVLVHPMVFGEVAMGSLEQRAAVLKTLRRLDRPVVARDAEVLGFIAMRRLFGRGIGFIDAHLLVSARVTPDTLLWSKDKRLITLAAELEVDYSPSGS